MLDSPLKPLTRDLAHNYSVVYFSDRMYKARSSTRWDTPSPSLELTDRGKSPQLRLHQRRDSDSPKESGVFRPGRGRGGRGRGRGILGDGPGIGRGRGKKKKNKRGKSRYSSRMKYRV